MIQDIAPHVYQNAFAANRAPGKEDLVLLYRGNELFVKKGEELTFPTVEEVLRMTGCMPSAEEGKDCGHSRCGLFPENGEDARWEGTQAEDEQTEPRGGRRRNGEDGTWRVWNLSFVFLFLIDKTAFYSVDELPERLADCLAEPAPGSEGQSSGYVFLPCGELRTAKPGWLAFAGITGAQLFRWRQDRKFCGCCGARMRPSRTERAFVCDGCGAVVYPKISPAVIVAVIHKDRILLTKYAHRTYARYALIAGFAEIGETIEETVHREVMEEAGIRVKNLHFYKSQPWSFSDTLLMGFFCELDGDDTITLDETELASGAWIVREEMPDRSDDISLTSEMMEQFRRGLDPFHRGKEEP